MDFWICCWIYPGDGPESLALAGVSGQRTRSLRPLGFSLPNDLVWCVSGLGPEVPRRWGGVSGPPESPAQGPGIFGPQFFHRFSAFVWCGSVGSPEHPRRVPGVSGLTGLSGHNDRNIRPSTSPARPESPVTWSGVSGLKRPQWLVFGEGL